MLLTDLSVKRPVLATVISLIIIAVGLVAFEKLPLREYPSIDPPVIDIRTNYRGASAAVVESRITQLIEDRVSGVEGIRNITSSSRDGRSSVTLQFETNRDIDIAANDVRDRVSRILNNLPDGAEPPEVRKSSGSSEVIMWLNLESDRMDALQLTDYARRFLLDRFSTVDGVATVHIGGGKVYALRIWIDRQALTARGLTVNDIEDALRSNNVELPAGSILSQMRQYSIRLERSFRHPDEFNSLTIARGENGELIRLADVARIELAAEEERLTFRGNGQEMVSLGVTRQSTANTLLVSRGVKQLVQQLNGNLPEGMHIEPTYDASVFIQSSVDEVYKTLFISLLLVILVIYLFLGSVRAMLIPALTVPISLIGSFIVLYALGYSINLLTLLAMILAIGMVVDDAIVMLENIHSRIEAGESPLVAAFLGARQVSFAIVATTLVLLAVFVPVSFLDGDMGRLFREFSVAMSAAVIFSSIVALSLSPMLGAKLLRPVEHQSRIVLYVDNLMLRIRAQYERLLRFSLGRWTLVIPLILLVCAASAWLSENLSKEFAPREDRGSIFVMISGPQGATYEYMEPYIDEIESRLMPLVEAGEIERLLIRAPRGWGRLTRFDNGMAIINLAPWGERRHADEIIQDIRTLTQDLAGVRVSPHMRQPFGRGVGSPVQFVLGGPTYEELVQWRDIILEHGRENPGLVGLDHDYHETQPQLKVRVDRERAADLGVSIRTIGRTLETMLGSRLVTSFENDGREYDIILEGERSQKSSSADISNLYVRADRGGLVPLSSLVELVPYADSPSLNRYNRIRAITLTANLAEDYSLGEALEYLNLLVETHLPYDAMVSYKGPSQDLQESNHAIMFVFILAMVMVFLVLAAQFESFVHPFVIMLTVPLATFGALLGLYLMDQTLNIYSQIGIIMLVGITEKNGILMVEFTNQLRDQGYSFEQAIIEGASARLRPILMTGITTAAGALPLVFSFGAGAETRFVIGVVILTGITLATLLTLFVIPVMYAMLCRGSHSPEFQSQQLESALTANKASRLSKAA